MLGRRFLSTATFFKSSTKSKLPSKALEKIVNNQQIKDALGEPILKGPWYNASLAVAHKRQSVSCTFPVSGPQGTGVLQLKAVRNGGTNILVISGIQTTEIAGSPFQSLSMLFLYGFHDSTAETITSLSARVEDTWFSFLRPRDWDIIIMDALLHVPGNDEKHQTLRISLSDYFAPPPQACTACTDCKPQESDNPDKK
ncbi:hypothetical protein TIFTF001_038112 [Ficus carica]|uniref:Uncharacterized protein n=1 Tax=Ficus carica TaxID=3494 RepID=A0AA88E890_FICCA|nr:hypothetical protein TIFTF001_038098 [Ficus carica]GMN69049.1 hypothetical protein TIFTF001_038103 [Ficus carica]GMN69057.1 hypothetical protein TIFTF001_038107 [Ficus carica]GMN69058.1 hypothetical protein TIFTF001_038112 [Ficus carica]